MNKSTDSPKMERGDKKVRCCVHDLYESIVLHWHDFYEIELILGGEGTHIVNGKEYEWRVGGMYLMGLTDFHEMRLKNGGRTYVIQLLPAGIPEELLVTISRFEGNIVTELTEKDFAYADVLCRMLCEYTSDDEAYNDQVVEHIVSLLLHLLFRAAGAAIQTGDKDKELFNKILAYLGENFRENLELKSIAENFHISKTYLCSYFKKCMGRTVMGYVRELRLEYAAKLTRVTTLKNSEICRACGYASMSNFLRDFKKYHACSPMKMRCKYHEKD